jgi:hypothetical protein
LMKQQGKGSVDFLKGDGDVIGVFWSIIRYFWFWHSVGQQRKNSFLERTTLNISNSLQITGECYWENPPVKVDDSIRDEFLVI